MSVYEILGVSPTATDAEIAKQYKILAKKYHPDKNNGDDSMMVKLNEAYKIIKTPEDRRKYDESNAFAADFDMLASVFGRPEVAKNFGKKPIKPKNMKHGTDIDLTVNLPVDMFMTGVPAMPITFTRHSECLECAGTGAKIHHVCPHCGGYGMIHFKGRKRKCIGCDGTGYKTEEKCDVCNGSGSVTKTVVKPINYMPGVLKLDLRGDGNNGSNGGENGNLHVKFNVTPCGKCSYDATDNVIDTTVEMYPEDLVLGTCVKVDAGNGREFNVVVAPEDITGVPFIKKVSGFLIRFNVTLKKTDSDTNMFTEIRNNRFNDII
ncbi:MAG: DnaJ domain-containing protein [Fibrobacter sp.]|nr:DnaJ domain-containing protein [Fibrobacter sp.]